MADPKEKNDDLIERVKSAMRGGGEERIEKQHRSGKLTARERIALLLDPDSFTETDLFVRHRCEHFGMNDRYIAAEGVVTGYGKVDSRTVFVFAQDFTSAGGTLGEMHSAKIQKIMDHAMSVGAPMIGINDSGGARIQEGVDAMSGYGRIFLRNTQASGFIPQFSLIMGPCAGGATYSPALTDFIFMVKNSSQMFITGPEVIKAITSEDVSAEDLGGAMTHNSRSGVAHFVTDSDHDCVQQARTLLSYLPSSSKEMPPIVKTGDSPDRTDSALVTILPDRSSKHHDMKKIISLIVDGHVFFETNKQYAKNIITGFARFDGHTVGIVANQPSVLAGCIDINASDKAARFIRFCDAFNIPLVNIVDVPGFLPGADQEFSGIIRHGAKMLYAYSEATVPKITLIIRKAYGGAYLAMCSRDLGADQVIAWPTSEIAVMGPAGAANIIFRNAPDMNEKILEYDREFANPYKAAERGHIDQIIDPKDTRPTLIKAIHMLKGKQSVSLPKKHGNIPL
jgi:methylmalonyl-CoA decarboxylase subunit alpha